MRFEQIIAAARTLVQTIVREIEAARFVNSLDLDRWLNRKPLVGMLPRLQATSSDSTSGLYDQPSYDQTRIVPVTAWMMLFQMHPGHVAGKRGGHLGSPGLAIASCPASPARG